jgi:uncharacterized protein (TIGR02117 family)
MRQFALIASVFFLAGCTHGRGAHVSRGNSADSEIQLASYTTQAPLRTIYVMSNGFHTGILMRRGEIPVDVWPEVREIADHQWVEVGWGSEIFYRAKKITAPVVFGAIVPNPSVLHVVGWERDPEETFVGLDLVMLEISDRDLASMCRCIHDTYVHDDEGHVVNLGPGIYADGAFFRARGKYYFPNTCNVWTARCLQAANVAIVPELCGMADPVLMAARREGKTIHRRGKPD